MMAPRDHRCHGILLVQKKASYYAATAMSCARVQRGGSLLGRVAEAGC